MTSPRRRRFGRLVRFAGWPILSLLVIVVLLYAFRGAIFGESGARALARLLSRELGTTISIDAIEGNYLTEIDLVGVRAAPAGSLARLEIARMKVTYPFLGILGGDPVAAIESVKADGLVLEVDTARPGAPRLHRPFSLSMLPARFPELVVSGTVSVRSGDDRFIAERVELSGAGNKFALVLDPLRLPDAWKLAPARVDAVLERTGPDTATWTSPSVIGGVALRSLGLEEKEAGVFELRYDLDVAAGVARGAATHDAIAFSLERVEAAALPDWVRGLVKDPDVLPARGLVDATGALQAWSRPSRNLRADVSATAVAWAGIDASSLKITGVWSGRRFELEKASAAVAGTAISAEAIMLDLDHPRVLVSARARAEGRDAAAFAHAIGLVRDAEALSPNSPRGELGTPWRLPRGWSLVIAASLAGGGVVTAENVVVESAELVIETSGTVQLGGRWPAWKEFPVAALWSARSKVAASRPVGEAVVVRAERVDGSGEARGTLGHPTGSFKASGIRASVAGIPLDRLSAAGTVDWPAIVVERLEATSGNDVVKASGKIDAERREVRDGTFEIELGSLATVNRVVPGMLPLWGRATVKGTIRRATPDRIELDATLAGRGVRIGKLELGTVDAELSLDGRALGVRRLKSVSRYGEVEAQGAVEIAELDAASADLRFTAVVPEIHAWSDFWKPLGRARGAARATGRVVKPAGTPIARSAWNASVRASALEVDAWTVGGASAEVAVRWPLVTVTSVDAQGPGGRVAGEAAFDLESGTLATAALDVDADVQTGSLPLGDGAPKLSGTARVAGRIEKVAGPDWRSFRGAVTVTSQDLRVEGRELREVLARVASADGTIRVEELSAVYGNADVSARGTVRPVEGGVDVELDALSVELEDGRSFALKDAVTVRRRAGVVSVGRFEIAGREGRLAGSATIGGELIDVALEGRGVDASLFAPEASGRIDLDVTASGKPADLVFSGRVHAPELKYRGRSAALEAKFRQENGQLRVEELVIDAGDLLRLEGSGRFPPVTLRDGKLALGPLTDSMFTLKGKTSGAVAWRELGIRAPSRLSDLALEVEARGPSLSLKGSAQLRVRRAREDESPVDVPVELTGRAGPDGALLHVCAGAGEAPLATARVESSRSWDWTQLASILEQGGDFQLGGRLDADVADSAPLAPFFPELRHLGGKLRVHADLAGTIAKPELSGFAELEAFSMRFEADAPGFDDVVARIKLEGRELTIERLEGKTGWSPFSVTGKATLESLRRPVLDVAVKGSNILIQRDEDVRVRADLDTTVKGPLDAMKLSGRARVTDAFWGQPMDLGAAGGKTGAPPGGGKRAPEAEPVFRFRDPPFSTATLDVEIVSDRSIRVENNLVKARLSARLALAGSGEAPRLEGRISTEHAFVRLPFTRLDVERAEIQFRPQDQYRARLDAVATARLKGYQLTVHVSGILPEVDVKVASLPPLSQRDAYLLLTTGITPAELEREGIAGATLYRAGSVYGTELLSQFSNASDENALERFSLEIGRDQSLDGRPTVDVEAPLSERFFLHGQRDRFDDYNAGIIWRLRFR